jgi:hypothetical protein
MSGIAKLMTALALAGAASLVADAAWAQHDDGDWHHRDNHRFERDRSDWQDADDWRGEERWRGRHHHHRPHDHWICAPYSPNLDGDDCVWGRENEHD